MGKFFGKTSHFITSREFSANFNTEYSIIVIKLELNLLVGMLPLC